MWSKTKLWFIGALALINTWEGITHLVSSGIGFWGMWETDTWAWQLIFTTSESLVFGLLSVLTGVILGKGMHHH